MRAFILLVLLALPSFCLADTIVFKNGRELEGKVLEQDATTMLIEVEYGTMRVSKDLIARVDPDTPEKLAQREAARQAREAAAEKETAMRAFEQQLKPEAQAKAKPQAKPKVAATATGNTNAQGNQPKWSDQYIEWRRAMRTGKTEGPGSYTRVRNERGDRMVRNPFNGNNTGGQGAGRARTPFNVNQFPNGLSDMARKYLGGR